MPAPRTHLKRLRGVRANDRPNRKYRAALNSLLDQLFSDFKKALEPVPIAQDVLPSTVAAVLLALQNRTAEEEARFEQIAKAFVGESDKLHRRAFERSTGIEVFGDAALRDFLDEAVADNVQLIKSLIDDAAADLASRISENISAGRRSADLIPELVERLNVNKSRAKLIARDQTSKVAGGLAKKRQQAAGFRLFRWRTAQDKDVRDRHHRIATQDVGFGAGVYSWDDLPLSDSGERIYPGADFQCRCTAEAVIEDR